jgi:hypothetical protein
LSYLCEPRSWADRVVAIAHDAKAFDLQFILNTAILFKWRPELIMNGMEILCMKMEHLNFSLRKFHKTFGLSSSKSWYSHYFNTEETLDYVGAMPDVSYYGLDEMGDSGRKDFLACYEGQKSSSVVFDNRRVLEQYCQDDVTVLWQASQVFRREFKEIGKINLFLESITIASACNKVLRKLFLQPNTIGLIPTGGYSGNVR